MRKNSTIKILFPFLTCFCIFAVSFAQSDSELKKFKSFASGEQLRYIIRYGFIHGGEASTTLKLLSYEGKTVYHARVVAQSTGIADKLFGVTDVYESFFDPNTCLPHKAIRDIKEGNYKYYNEVFFQHEDSTLYNDVVQSSLCCILQRIMNRNVKKSKESN